MKKILLSFFISLFLAAGAGAQTLGCRDMVWSGKFPAAREVVSLLCKKRFIVGYSTARHNPLWVAESLSAAQVAANQIPRNDNFRIDSNIPALSQAALSEFNNTGYDRGHMVPYEDVNDSAIAADESFILTNIVPQTASMNRVIWRVLEDRVRKLTVGTTQPIFIITGPIFSVEPRVLAKGTQVPSHLWKVVIIPEKKQVLTVIIPNVDGLMTHDLPNFITTMNDLLMQNRHLSLGYNITGFKELTQLN